MTHDMWDNIHAIEGLLIFGIVYTHTSQGLPIWVDKIKHMEEIS